MTNNKKKTNQQQAKRLKYKKHYINIHDAYFKIRFSEIGQAKQILKFALTKEEQKLFNWNSLREEKDSFPDSKRADLIFSIAFKALPKTRIKIYILFEHKSQKDKKVFGQLLFYKHQIIEREFLKTQQTPGVLTVIFYHGKSPWTGKVAFEERAFKPKLKDKKIMSFLDKTMVEYRVRILDIRQSPEVEVFLKKRSKSYKEKKTQLALYVLKEIQGLSRKEVLNTEDTGFLNNLLIYLKGLPRKEGFMLLLEVMNYIEKKFNLSWDELERTMKETTHYKKEDDMENIFIESHNQKRRQEGRKEGRQEERQQTALRMLAEKMDISQISRFTGLSVKKVKELKKRVKK